MSLPPDCYFMNYEGILFAIDLELQLKKIITAVFYLSGMFFREVDNV